MRPATKLLTWASMFFIALAAARLAAQPPEPPLPVIQLETAAPLSAGELLAADLAGSAAAGGLPIQRRRREYPSSF